jgi:hypothetical protein
MNDQNKLSDSNQLPSYRRHKRQTFWQVLLPVLLSALLVLAGLVFLILTATQGDPAGQLSGWADTSLIWLLLPVMGLGLIGILLLGGLIYLLARLLKILPTYTALVQQYFAIGEGWVKGIAARALHPVISAKSAQAGAGQFLKSLFSFTHR